jgi:hypothetical protein
MERPSRPLAQPSNVPRAQPLALGKEFYAECIFKTLGKELKKSNSHIQTFCFINLHPYKAYAQISDKNKYLFCI